MIQHATDIRIRYGETDQMGVAYYGNYPLFYEVGRTELIRKSGFSYKELENRGIYLPVIELNVQYIKPVFYDELITVVTYLNELPGVKIKFDYEIYNKNQDLTNKGSTILAFINTETGKPCKAPSFFMDKLVPFFE